MKTLRQPESANTRAAEDWSPETVLAMNLFLLTRPDLDVQRWFEKQVALHLGCSPHGGRVDDSPTVCVSKPKLTRSRNPKIHRPII